MSMEKYLSEQYRLHPSESAQDVIKQCYQAAFGAEHLMTDKKSAKEYFIKEYKSCPPSDAPLFEPISEDTARVNLGAWKKAGLSPDLLFDLFSESAAPRENGKTLMISYLSDAKKIFPEYSREIDEYIHIGMPPVRHSEGYRAAEDPHYRIVKKALLDFLSK